MGAMGFGHGILRLRVRVLAARLRWVIGGWGYGAFKHF